MNSAHKLIEHMAMDTIFEAVHHPSCTSTPLYHPLSSSSSSVCLTQKLKNQNLPIKLTMLRRIIKIPLNLTSTLYHHHSPFRFFSADSAATHSTTELTRVPSLLEGCDYKHWLVVMEAPKEYPLRDEIVNGYIKTLAMALGSEEEAKRSIYSVSTKYYYAFGCRVPEILTHKIKSLPNVKWVLPDSYLCDDKNGYGGEPFIDGEVVPYDEKYHTDWIHPKKSMRK